MPEKIGRYEIEKELGRGGMAVVYLARDPLMDRPVAVKVLPRQFTFDPNFRERFRREARLVAKLQHPAIVPVYDFGEEDDQLYLVMAYMSGGSLHERLRGGPLPLVECARIMGELAPGLDAAHQEGMIHRDLKPANILFDQWDKPYLADFGITKLIAGSDTALTATGGLVGTPAYMSPEQAMAKKELDGRSDLYAMGVIFFQMVTGRTPFMADTPMGLALEHISAPVPKVAEDNPKLPTATQSVIDKAMAKDREGRYESAVVFCGAIKELTGDRKLAPPPDETQVEELPMPDSATTELEAAAVKETKDVPRPASGVGFPKSTEVRDGDGRGAEAKIAVGRATSRQSLSAKDQNTDKVGSPNRALRFWPLFVTGALAGCLILVGSIVLWASGVFGDGLVVAEQPNVDGIAPGQTATQPVSARPPSSAFLDDTWTRPSDGMVMVYVPEGSFMMGSTAGDEDAYGGEFPQHEVALELFGWTRRR